MVRAQILELVSQYHALQFAPAPFEKGVTSIPFAGRVFDAEEVKLLVDSSLDFWLTTEDLPDPNNRVKLGSDGTIELHYTPNNEEGHHRLLAKLKELMKLSKMEDHMVENNLYLGKQIPIAGVAHQNGTIRFGKDPATSVLDVNCKAHELDNLYVVDGGFFVSSGAVNPALTIMANALRVGDHLIQRLGAS